MISAREAAKQVVLLREKDHDDYRANSSWGDGVLLAEEDCELDRAEELIQAAILHRKRGVDIYCTVNVVEGLHSLDAAATAAGWAYRLSARLRYYGYNTKVVNPGPIDFFKDDLRCAAVYAVVKVSF